MFVSSSILLKYECRVGHLFVLIGPGHDGCSGECCFGVMYVEWYGVCDIVVFSVVEICVDYGHGSHGRSTSKFPYFSLTKSKNKIVTFTTASNLPIHPFMPTNLLFKTQNYKVIQILSSIKEIF